MYSSSSVTPNITLSNAAAPTVGSTDDSIIITPKKVYAGASDMAENRLLMKSGKKLLGIEI